MLYLGASTKRNAKVMRVSTAFLNQMFELIDLSSFNFIMPMLPNFVDQTYAFKDVLF